MSIRNKSILTIVFSLIVFVALQINYQFSAGAATAKKVIKQEQKLTFVLVHGAWADASFYKETAAELKKRGHKVYVPNYDTDKPNATHEQYTKTVVDYIKQKNLKNVVLVGHSFGGTIIMKVSEQIPDRFSRVVFLNAFAPKDGESVSDQFPGEIQQVFGQLAMESGNGTIMLPFEIFREGFANTATLEEAKKMYKTIKPEPGGPLVAKLDLKKFYSLKLPKSYVFLTQDNVLPHTEQYAWHPKQSGNLGQFRYIEGNGDHMTTAHKDPKQIAQKLVEAGRP